MPSSAVTRSRTSARLSPLVLAALLPLCGNARAQTGSVPIASPTASARARAIDLTRRAAQEFSLRRYASTVALCRQSIRADATYVRAYTWLGAAQQKLGQLSAARQAFGRVLALAPSSADAARARRGLAEVRREENRLAIVKRRKSRSLFRLAWSARAHAGGVRALAWRPDGALLASGGSDYKVRWWRAQDGKSVGEAGSYREDVISLAWSPDGSVLAVGSFDNRLDILRASFNRQAAAVTASVDRTLESGGYDVNALAWSSVPGQAPLLAAGLGDGSIRIWSTSGGLTASNDPNWSLLRVLRGHSAGVSQVAFASSVAQGVAPGALVSASLDASARAWNLSNGSTLWVAAREGAASIGVEPSGARVAVATGSLVQWRAVRSDRLLRSQAMPRASLAQAAWSPDGKLLAIGAYTPQVRLWDARGVFVGNFNTLSPASRALAWSPDSRSLAVAGADGWVRVWRRSST